MIEKRVKMEPNTKWEWDDIAGIWKVWRWYKDGENGSFVMKCQNSYQSFLFAFLNIKCHFRFLSKTFCSLWTSNSEWDLMELSFFQWTLSLFFCLCKEIMMIIVSIERGSQRIRRKGRGEKGSWSRHLFSSLQSVPWFSSPWKRGQWLMTSLSHHEMGRRNRSRERAGNRTSETDPSMEASFVREKKKK